MWYVPSRRRPPNIPHLQLAVPIVYIKASLSGIYVFLSEFVVSIRRRMWTVAHVEFPTKEHTSLMPRPALYCPWGIRMYNECIMLCMEGP